MSDQIEKLPLSVVIIALNEESNISRAVSSVNGWVSEVFVYDSGSTDNTKSIAENRGAKVVSGPWLGFGPTKKKAADLAANSWILSIDSDEEVSAELRSEIQKKFMTLDDRTAYQLPRKSFYLNRWVMHGGWYPDHQARLFNKKFSNWNAAEIHEKVEASSYQKLSSDLNHYVFKNIDHQVATNNRYSTLQAKEMAAKGKSFSWFHFFTKPAVKFFECYFLKLGFLDGWPGFVIAKSASYSVFLKWAKLYEIKKLGKNE
ncbi:MAG: putative glycosyl transferase [Pseudobdellovibrio sp.]|nr:putative glycosyl transferase [Pseudobdellovibrio sp.]